MAKLKDSIYQLAAAEFQSIHNSLVNSEAEQAAKLFRYLREDKLSEEQIQEALNLYGTSYYALCSRLQSKIEEYLLEQMDTPRSDLSRKVAAINQFILTKKQHVAIMVLKRLEKELLKGDLSNELTIVYKTLKRIHINSPEYFTYSQLYNKHIAYMLAVDKVEDLVAEFFKKYGVYSLTAKPQDLIPLSFISNEIQNINKLYTSHRLYIHESVVYLFYQLVIESNPDLQDIEKRFKEINRIFKSYRYDTLYQQLYIVFDVLQYIYYVLIGDNTSADKYMKAIQPSLSFLLSNYHLYIYPPQFLITHIHHLVSVKKAKELYKNNITLLYDFEPDPKDVPGFFAYMVYRSISCYYSERYEEAIRWLKKLLKDVDISLFPTAMIEVQILITLFHILLHENIPAKSQLAKISSAIEIAPFHVKAVYTILHYGLYKKEGESVASKMRDEFSALQKTHVSYFSPLLIIQLDKKQIGALIDYFEYI